MVSFKFAIGSKVRSPQRQRINNVMTIVGWYYGTIGDISVDHQYNTIYRVDWCDGGYDWCYDFEVCI